MLDWIQRSGGICFCWRDTSSYRVWIPTSESYDHLHKMFLQSWSLSKVFRTIHPGSHRKCWGGPPALSSSVEATTSRIHAYTHSLTYSIFCLSLSFLFESMLPVQDHHILSHMWYQHLSLSHVTVVVNKQAGNPPPLICFVLFFSFFPSRSCWIQLYSPPHSDLASWSTVCKCRCTSWLLTCTPHQCNL